MVVTGVAEVVLLAEGAVDLEVVMVTVAGPDAEGGIEDAAVDEGDVGAELEVVTPADRMSAIE